MKEQTKPNQLAFPCDGEYAGDARNDNDAGLTKREYMAIEFTKAYAGSDYVANSGVSHENIAKWGIKMADELIKQLNLSK